MAREKISQSTQHTYIRTWAVCGSGLSSITEQSPRANTEGAPRTRSQSSVTSRPLAEQCHLRTLVRFEIRFFDVFRPKSAEFRTRFEDAVTSACSLAFYYASCLATFHRYTTVTIPLPQTVQQRTENTARAKPTAPRAFVKREDDSVLPAPGSLLLLLFDALDELQDERQRPVSGRPHCEAVGDGGPVG